MTLLPPVVKPMTDFELHEATCKELAFFMDESVRLRDELTEANAEIERLQAKLKKSDETKEALDRWARGTVISLPESNSDV